MVWSASDEKKKQQQKTKTKTSTQAQEIPKMAQESPAGGYDPRWPKTTQDDPKTLPELGFVQKSARIFILILSLS